MIKKLVSHLGEYKAASIKTPLFAALEAIMDVLLPTIMAFIIDQGIEKGDMNAIIRYGLLTFLVAAIALVLGDEMLTPDSSRFWPLEGYEPGHSQPSFDKQFVRDWLKANPDSNYDLPQDVIDKTIAKYLEAYELLTGKKL